MCLPRDTTSSVAWDDTVTGGFTILHIVCNMSFHTRGGAGQVFIYTFINPFTKPLQKIKTRDMHMNQTRKTQ